MMFMMPLAIAAGLVAHLGIFIRGEWHLRIRSIVSVHAFLVLIALCISQYNTNSFSDSVLGVAKSAICYLAILFASMITYRLYFHPLSRFPGPRLAAITKLWHVYQSRNSTNYLVMERMHRKYGKFVRTGPNEISIFHPGAFEMLADAKNTARRDEFYDVLQPRFSVVFTRDKGEHKALRALWAQGFSSKSMDEYMPRLIALSQGLRDCIDSFGEQPINVTDVMTWFSFDVMGEVILGRDFGMMKSHAENPIMAQQRRGLALLGPIIDVQWIVHLAFTFFPFVRQVQDFIKMCLFCEHEVLERMTRGKNGKPDLASRFIEEYEASKGIETETKRLQLLNGNIISAIVAGSDTNRGAMTAIWWYLSKYPKEAIKIQKELADIEAHDVKRLAKLPHLNGAINEVLRLAPPAMTGNNRICGPEGLWVDDVLIPADVTVTTPRYVIQRLECAFVHAADFIPERWYSRPEFILDKRAFAPFSLGAHQCVGKNLAMAELRLNVAVLLQQYDVAFAPDYDPDTMWRDMKDQVTAQPGRVLCTFKARDTNKKSC